MRALDAAKVYTLLPLLGGLLYARITPPFRVADEPTHFIRAYHVSEGGIVVPWRNSRTAPNAPPKSNGRARCSGQMQVARQRVVGANTVLKEVSPFQGSFGVKGSYPGLREYAYPGLKNAAPLGLRNRENTAPLGLRNRVP